MLILPFADCRMGSGSHISSHGCQEARERDEALCSNGRGMLHLLYDPCMSCSFRISALPNDKQLFHHGCHHGRAQLYAHPTSTKNEVIAERQDDGAL